MQHYSVCNPFLSSIVELWVIKGIRGVPRVERWSHSSFFDGELTLFSYFERPCFKIDLFLDELLEYRMQEYKKSKTPPIYGRIV